MDNNAILIKYRHSSSMLLTKLVLNQGKCEILFIVNTESFR